MSFWQWRIERAVWQNIGAEKPWSRVMLSIEWHQSQRPKATGVSTETWGLSLATKQHCIGWTRALRDPNWGQLVDADFSRQQASSVALPSSETSILRNVHLLHDCREQRYSNNRRAWVEQLVYLKHNRSVVECAFIYLHSGMHLQNLRNGLDKWQNDLPERGIQHPRFYRRTDFDCRFPFGPNWFEPQHRLPEGFQSVESIATT